MGVGDPLGKWIKSLKRKHTKVQTVCLAIPANIAQENHYGHAQRFIFMDGHGIEKRGKEKNRK
jgi:hypothetical protein